MVGEEREQVAALAVQKIQGEVTDDGHCEDEVAVRDSSVFISFVYPEQRYEIPMGYVASFKLG